MKRGGEKEEGWIGEKVCLRMGSVRAGKGREGGGNAQSRGKTGGPAKQGFSILLSREK